MPKVLVVTGSVRPNSVNQAVVEEVINDLNTREGVKPQIADLGALALPFFDSEVIPSGYGFHPAAENIQAWTQMVREANAIVLVTPEYNRTMSAVQKNALDWIYGAWQAKPVALIGYGWSGGEKAHATARDVLDNLKARVQSRATNLYFSKQLSLNGEFIGNEGRESIAATLDELLNTL